MRVRMNVSIAGLEFSYSAQQEVDIEDDLAKKWLACGHASPVVEEPTESVPAPEMGTGTDPAPRAKRKGR